MKLIPALFCATAAVSLGGCMTLGNDEGERYLQRKEGVTLSAGDAKEVNRNTQMLAAWPQGVNDRHIPANGQRMANAVKNYRCGPSTAGGQGGAQGQGGGSGNAQSQTNVTINQGPQAAAGPKDC